MGKLLRDPITGETINIRFALKRLGSTYGGWVIPDGILSKSSICYCVGAGEDISFDYEVAKEYRSKVYVIDPTKRAREHFEVLSKDKIKNSGKNLKQITYLNFGIAGKTGKRKFYEPRNPGHISYSIVNLQKTNNYFEAMCYSIRDLMKRQKHNELDLLKLDIEGAEYEVIDSLLKDKVDVNVICVEFDELYNPIDSRYKKRVKKIVKRLIKADYLLVFIDPKANYTFVKKNLTLKKSFVNQLKFVIDMLIKRNLLAIRKLVFGEGWIKGSNIQ